MKVQAKLLVTPILTVILMAGALVHSSLAKESAHQSSSDNFFKLGVALLQYSDDHDGKLPPMQDAATVKKSLYGFLADSALVQPETGHRYIPNPAYQRKITQTSTTKKDCRVLSGTVWH